MTSFGWRMKLSYQIHRDEIHWEKGSVKMYFLIFYNLFISLLTFLTILYMFSSCHFHTFPIIQSFYSSICSSYTIMA